MSDISDFEDQWADTPDSFYSGPSDGLTPTPTANRDEDWEPPLSKSARKKRNKSIEQAKISQDSKKEKATKDSEGSRRKSKRKNKAEGSNEKETVPNPTDPEPSTSKATSPEKQSPKNGEASPERACAICLGPIDNKSFTDQCFHEFCFLCLDEWAKVKAVCPLCKQPFRKIIYNVRSIDDFDEKQIPSKEMARPHRFRYRTTATAPRQFDINRRPRRHFGASAMNLPLLNWRNPRNPPGYGTCIYRKRVYAQSLRVKELRNSGGREPRNRNISPEFFRSNPACTHRLVPWLNRELNMLLYNHYEHIMFVMDLILSLIKKFDIQSAEFAEHLRPFLGSRTSHFQHEFLWFARSPYDMATFDRHAVYESANPHLVESSTNSSSDEDALRIPHLFRSILPSPPAPRTSTVTSQDSTSRYLGQTLSSLNTDLTQGNVPQSGWESPLPGPSGLSSLTTADNPVLLVSTDEEDTISFTDQNEPNPNTNILRKSGSGSQASDNANEFITIDSPASSHSSDILCVAVEKPWEERSPIMLISSEEEEGDLSSQMRSRIAETHETRKDSSSARKRKSEEGGIHLSHDRQRKKSKKRRHVTPPLQYRYRVRSQSRSPLNSEKDRYRRREKYRHRRSRSRSRSRNTDIHVYVRSRHRSRSRDPIVSSGSEHSYRHRKHKHKKHKKHKHKHHREERQKRKESERYRKERQETYRRDECLAYNVREKEPGRKEKLNVRTEPSRRENDIQPLKEVLIPDSNIRLCKMSSGYAVRDWDCSPEIRVLSSPSHRSSEGNKKSTERQESATSTSSAISLTFKKHHTGHKTSKPKKTLETIVWEIKNGQDTEKINRNAAQNGEKDAVLDKSATNIILEKKEMTPVLVSPTNSSSSVVSPSLYSNFSYSGDTSTVGSGVESVTSTSVSAENEQDEVVTSEQAESSSTCSKRARLSFVISNKSKIKEKTQFE